MRQVIQQDNPMNTNRSTDDFFRDGITPWAARVRAGALSFRETMEACLQRTADSQTLDAFECLDVDRALTTASALDVLLQNGVDYGPLMGVPTGIKDIMVVEGLQRPMDQTRIRPRLQVLKAQQCKGCVAVAAL